MSHDDYLGIRTSRPLRAMVDVAAERRGTTASAWAREAMRREAVRQLAGDEREAFGGQEDGDRE